MGVEWNNDANQTVVGLLKSWSRGREQYLSQIEEAKRAGTPHSHMQGCADQLFECIHNLERELKIPEGERLHK